MFKATSATLYGGLNYDTSTADLIASSRAYTDVESIESSPFELDSHITRKGWKYLPGTEKEIEQITRILGSKRIQLVSFTQSRGTEEAFKSMSGKSTPVLHIATHGFYLSEKEASRVNPALRSREENDSHSYPLKRCGLILSGGQHAWLGEELPTGIEDGILTGEEIAGLDLSGTELVVLSACQTGLGDLSRDGVVCDDVTVKPNDWTDSVYISTGLMRVAKDEEGNITRCKQAALTTEKAVAQNDNYGNYENSKTLRN